MGFFSEIFAPARAKPDRNLRDAMRLLNGMSRRDLADIGIKPADFSRIAREMADR